MTVSTLNRWSPQLTLVLVIRDARHDLACSTLHVLTQRKDIVLTSFAIPEPTEHAKTGCNSSKTKCNFVP